MRGKIFQDMIKDIMKVPMGSKPGSKMGHGVEITIVTGKGGHDSDDMPSDSALDGAKNKIGSIKKDTPFKKGV
jgi:hypothetical protein